MNDSLVMWLVLAGVALLVYGALRHRGAPRPEALDATTQAALFGALVMDELQHEHALEHQEEHEQECLDEEDN